MGLVTNNIGFVASDGPPSQPPSPNPATTTTTTGTNTVGGGGAGWFSAVMGIFTPKTAGPLAIQQPQPVSSEQQAANQRLFIVAMVVMLLMLGVVVWYFLKS